ncbi:MAG: Gldg family protein [Pseudomonadota bacterium]
MDTNRTKALGLSALAIIAVLFIAAVMLTNTLFRGVRLDLTENQLYTLSDGTRAVLGDIDEPINLYYFFSDRATEDLPQWRAYSRRVRETLEEFVAISRGKLNLQVIDPQPFSEEEDEASRFGLPGVPVRGAEDGIFFGLAATNSVDDEEIIPFFDPAKEEFLEYDLARLIYTLDNPEKPVVGLLSSMPLQSGFDPLTNRMREPWAVSTQIQQLFEVRNLEDGLDAIEEEIDVLLVVHPKSLSEQTLYAIDQFVMAGGRAMIFVDPFSQFEQIDTDPNDPTAAMMADRSSNLATLFDAWGIEFSVEQGILDAGAALQVPARSGRGAVSHLGLIGLSGDSLTQQDVVTSGLTSMNFLVAGYFGLAQDSPLELQPLVVSTPESALAPVQRFKVTIDPAELQDGFEPSGERWPIAVRVSGELPSAFAEGAPAAAPVADDLEAAPAVPAHRANSNGPVNLVLVGDVDLLADQLWVRVQRLFGERLLEELASNGAFVINTLDNLTGSSDLIGVRGRASFVRPFQRVEDLRREAALRFRDTEQQLQKELEETESRLTELQSSRTDADNLLILSDEQREEIERFQARKLEIRQELRRVRRELDKDIEQLGTVLKITNIALVPLLIILFAVGSAWFTGRRPKEA